MTSLPELVPALQTLLTTTADLAGRDSGLIQRVRWQIEFLFKLWKSHGKIDAWRSADRWRIHTEIDAKLVAMVIQHWLLVVTSWHDPERSMVKGAQAVRAHACDLACVFT
jgi:hypothetical protein